VDIKNAKNGAKTTKLWLKQVLGLICKQKLSFGAKLKKTGPIRNGSLRWKDRVAILEKLRALFAKTRG
jgi:hypothetical protein